MRGETDLKRLLAGMEPVLAPEEYGFGLTEGAVPDAFALIREDEGLTVVAPLAVLETAGIETQGVFARISLTVHSDLEAVGLTAAISAALAAEGISANVVAGLFHDHFFVQWGRRHDAMRALVALSR